MAPKRVIRKPSFDQVVFESEGFEPRNRTWNFICPHCKTQRRLPGRPRPSFTHFIQVGLTALAFTLGTWPWFGWKGIVSFIPFWMVFEMVFRLRVRSLLICTSCGFDPILYLSDEERAKKAIEQFWRTKFAEKKIPYPGDAKQETLESQKTPAEGPDSGSGSLS